MKIFFYGLFMDERLLSAKGITPTEVKLGFVEGYGLRIGERASLVRRHGGRAFGVIMDIAPGEVKALYSLKGVEDYVPEPVTAELLDGTKVEATCYNLPVEKITGNNPKYAESLLAVAIRLGFPAYYLDEIRRA